MFRPNFESVAMHPTLNPSPVAIAVTLAVTAIKYIPKVMDVFSTVSSTIELTKK